MVCEFFDVGGDMFDVVVGVEDVEEVLEFFYDFGGLVVVFGEFGDCVGCGVGVVIFIFIFGF